MAPGRRRDEFRVPSLRISPFLPHSLTSIRDQVFACGVGRPWFGPLEEVRVVAALAQLHRDVEQPGAVSSAVHHLDVLLDEALVVVALHLAQANLEEGAEEGREEGGNGGKRNEGTVGIRKTTDHRNPTSS